MERAIRLLIADDHAVVRDGIAGLLLGAGIDVVGQAINGCDALEKAVQLKPDVVLMDIAMPVMDGLVATEELCRTMPKVRVIVLTMHEEQAYVRRAMLAGAAGYVRKDSSAEKLLKVISLVNDGTQVFPALTRDVEEKNILTPCETAVLVLLVKGINRNGKPNRRASNQLIADELGVAVSTVVTHRERINDKLNKPTPLAQVQYAKKYGLI